MAAKQLSSDFMQQIADVQAWKELSQEISWTESLLEKYQDKVDWEGVAGKDNILWFIPMVKKLKNRIDWERFSSNADEKLLTEDSIETFKDKWD